MSSQSFTADRNRLGCLIYSIITEFILVLYSSTPFTIPSSLAPFPPESALCKMFASLSFWDPNLVSELLSDRVAKNLMYIEAVADVDRGHWEVGRERRGELTSLQKKGQKKEVSGGGREGGGKEGGRREGREEGGIRKG